MDAWFLIEVLRHKGVGVQHMGEGFPCHLVCTLVWLMRSWGHHRLTDQGGGRAFLQWGFPSLVGPSPCGGWEGCGSLEDRRGGVPSPAVRAWRAVLAHPHPHQKSQVLSVIQQRIMECLFLERSDKGIFRCWKARMPPHQTTRSWEQSRVGRCGRSGTHRNNYAQSGRKGVSAVSKA